MIKLKLILALLCIISFSACRVRIKQKDVYIGNMHYIVIYNDAVKNTPIQVIKYSLDSAEMDMYLKYGGTYDRDSQKDAR